jgi:hypothetical protein
MQIRYFKANVRPLPESCFKAVNNFLNATCPILGVPDVLKFMIMLDSPFYRLQPKYDERKQKLVNQLGHDAAADLTKPFQDKDFIRKMNDYSVRVWPNLFVQ